jgi:hypothetical protein
MKRLYHLVAAIVALSTVGVSIAAPEADKTAIYPYLVNREYGPNGKPPTADGISYELGHNLYVSLVVDLHGSVRNLTLTDLKSLSLTRDQAHALALKNLEREWDRGELKPHAFNASSGQTFVLENLRGSGPVLVSVPHRNAMLIFAVGTRQSRDEMRALINANESNQPHPRTMELFLVENGKVAPFRER